MAGSTGKALGALEVTVRFEPVGGGEAVESTTTPSMWAAADEWADTLHADGHTDRWVGAKMVDAICLSAAQAEGLARPGAPTLQRIAELKNSYNYRILDDGADEGGEPPNAPAPAGPAA